MEYSAGEKMGRSLVRPGGKWGKWAEWLRPLLSLWGLFSHFFTALAGALLDHATCAFEPARPALEALAAAGIPLILCTSKTRAETERWRRALGNAHPFIVENGGAVFIPEGYFAFDAGFDRREGGYGILELGRPYAELRRALDAIRKATGLPFCGG